MQAGKGTIDVDDLREACLTFNLPIDVWLLEQVFDYCDVDGDGKINYLEFSNFLNWKENLPSGFAELSCKWTVAFTRHPMFLLYCNSIFPSAAVEEVCTMNGQSGTPGTYGNSMFLLGHAPLWVLAVCMGLSFVYEHFVVHALFSSCMDYKLHMNYALCTFTIYNM